MAEAKIETKEREVLVTKRVKEKQVVLRLSDDEAHYLAAIVACTGGSPALSPRRHGDAIVTALRGAGYHWGKRESVYQLIDGNKSIHFKNYPDSVE